MSPAPWWQNAVVYQVYPRSFADSDGDGVGDLRGIIERLDHLQRLGIDVVWVSPFYRSPMADNGYDVADYCSVDPLFGTLDDVDDLIDGLHRRGMKLMIDIVVNHCSIEHPWFQASRSSVTDPQRDWFWWRPARPGTEPGQPGAEPTNWMTFFSQPAWTFDETTGEYYLHLFTPEQPDLNWEHPEVRAEVYDMLRWWLARGVDGFRFDVINLISKRLPLVDGPPIDGGPLGSGFAQFVDGPRMEEFLQEMYREVNASQDEVLITVGECPGVTVEAARRYTDADRPGLDMVFQFEHMGVDSDGDRYRPRPLDLVALKATLGRWQEGLADVGWNSLYWNNHDQPRAVSRFGSDDPRWRVRSAKLLGTVLHLHRGTPYVYQGEELGMANYAWTSLDEFDDVETRNYVTRALAGGRSADELLAVMRDRSRDNGRFPMQWDASPNAGFTTGTPWLPVHSNHTEVNAAAQIDDPDSVFAHYRRLIELRHTMPLVAEGAFEMLLPADPTVYAFTRRLGDEALLVVANFSGEPVTVDVPDADHWAGAPVLLTNTDNDDAFPAAGPLALAPWEALVFITTA